SGSVALLHRAGSRRHPRKLHMRHCVSLRLPPCGGDIDRGAVHPDGALGVSLLADDDLAAMDSDPEGRSDAELLQILAPLPPDRRKDGVDRPQDPVAPQRFAPIPQRNQTVALVKIDLAAVIGNWLGHIEEKFAYQ